MTRPMIVHGITIPPEALDAARDWMAQQVVPFTANEAERELQEAGVYQRAGRGTYAERVSYRAMDRLLQSERKAGRIRFAGGLWSRVMP